MTRDKQIKSLMILGERSLLSAFRWAQRLSMVFVFLAAAGSYASSPEECFPSLPVAQAQGLPACSDGENGGGGSTQGGDGSSPNFAGGDGGNPQL